MGLFSKLFGGSVDQEKNVTNDTKEVVSEKVDSAITEETENVAETVEEKKDSCCGGNCGS